MKNKLSRRNFIRNTFAGSVLTPFMIKNISATKYEDDLKVLKSNELHKLKCTDVNDEKYWKFVRAQFPLTYDRYYLNTSGLGASPRIVIDTVYDWTLKLEEICETGHGNVHKVHEKTAKLWNVDPEEIAITRNTTEGMNILARTLPLEKGDEVILTTHEHPGGAIPWLAVQKDIGIKIKLVEPDLTGENNFEIIEKSITKKTKVISIDHVPCTTGMIFPVKEIVQLCRSKNIFTCFDGAHPPGMMPVDLRDIDPDFYATSGHKWLFGPKGTGLLFINKKTIGKLKPKYVGAYSDKKYVLEDLILDYKLEANREEYGTRGTPLVMGLGAGIDFINNIGIKNIQKRGKNMAEYLKAELQKISKIEILTPLNPEYSASVVTFRVKDKKYSELQGPLLKDYKCRTRGIHEHGLNGIRISCAVYNNYEELDGLVHGVKKLTES